ncbi:MAG: hypothetical protein EPO24_04080 [Bacteroidetes bacterium]|nr:MAG: hypothetical protein EPO24_04080 [Bacteroidota bacterium]
MKQFKVTPRLRTLILVAMTMLMVTLPALASTQNENGSSGYEWLIGLGSLFGVGLVVNASTLVGLQKNFRAIFQEAYDAIEPQWPQVCMETQSEGADENYQWLGEVPGMREWLGDKEIKGLAGVNYILQNKDWESTIEVKRKDIEDDRLGIYKPKIISLAEEGRRHPDELLTSVRVAGTSTTCYDGKNFYATNHVMRKSGSLSNLHTGTGITLAQVTADLKTARAKMRNLKNDQGKPFIKSLGKLKLLVTAPPDLEGVFEELSNATTISNTTNVLKGAFDYNINPYLTDANDWYLDFVGSAIRPFVFQTRKKPIFVAMEDPNNSDTVFKKGSFLYSVEARYNCGYGMWQFSHKISNS